MTDYSSASSWRGVFLARHRRHHGRPHGRPGGAGPGQGRGRKRPPDRCVMPSGGRPWFLLSRRWFGSSPSWCCSQSWSLDLTVIGQATTHRHHQGRRPLGARLHRPCGGSSRSGCSSSLPGSCGQEFVAGYITEYSLSVDNLFVFMIIMARFAVPELAQDKVLYIGIVLSLVLRAVFIFAGAAAIAACELGVLHPRRVPGLHRDPVGARGLRRGAGFPQERRAAVSPPHPADQRGLRRPPAGHPRRQGRACSRRW